MKIDWLSMKEFFIDRTKKYFRPLTHPKEYLLELKEGTKKVVDFILRKWN